MHCRRCEGLMIAIRMKDIVSGLSAPGWRCLLCGETTDDGIEKNRKEDGRPDSVRARLPGTPRAG